MHSVCSSSYSSPQEPNYSVLKRLEDKKIKEGLRFKNIFDRKLAPNKDMRKEGKKEKEGRKEDKSKEYKRKKGKKKGRKEGRKEGRKKER